MSKSWPLEIQNAGSDTYIVMSRGHHDLHEFMRAVRADGYDWPLGMPEHKWVRCVPDRSGEFNYRYSFEDGPGRGIFPATFAWEACREDRYETIMAQQKDTTK